MELHGGSVDLTSAGSGQGSRVELRLPVQADRGLVPAEPPAAALPAGGGAQVLVVDDNQDSADSMSELLGLLGFATAVAYDGIEGLARVRELRPRVAILDLGMPGMSGLELARHVRCEDWGRDMLLIALSGWGREHDRQQSASAGFDHHFVKPVDLDALAHVIAAPRKLAG
ncbi:MAG: response regulator [Burkholderiaceae bacterium]